MREVSVFYAYDDTRFFDYDECEAYESDAFDKMEELIVDDYEFFDADGQEMLVFLCSLEEGLNNFRLVYNKCSRIRVKRIPSLEAREFLCVTFGCDIPTNEIGLYEYDNHRLEWIKVE